jgi:hypothetical protein
MTRTSDKPERTATLRPQTPGFGGDGTLNTVAQAAHDAGCAMGVAPQGTFKHCARAHGLPADPADAVRLLPRSAPAPVQVAGINDHVFLVQISDTQFGTEQRPLVEASGKLAHRLQPDVLVLSGGAGQAWAVDRGHGPRCQFLRVRIFLS